MSNNSQLLNFIGCETLKKSEHDMKNSMLSQKSQNSAAKKITLYKKNNTPNTGTASQQNIGETTMPENSMDDRSPPPGTNSPPSSPQDSKKPKLVSTLDVLAMIKSLQPQQIWMSGSEQQRRGCANQKQVVNIQSVGTEDENKFQIQLSSIQKTEEPFSDLTLNVNPSRDISERNSYVIDVIQSLQQADIDVNVNPRHMSHQNYDYNNSWQDLDDTINKRRKDAPRKKNTGSHDKGFIIGENSDGNGNQKVILKLDNVGVQSERMHPKSSGSLPRNVLAGLTDE